MTITEQTRVALITGGTAGLGLALTRALTAQGWHVITDGRHEGRIREAMCWDDRDGVTAIMGDVTDAVHRADLLRAVQAHGRLDLLVHNASTLGPLPMRPLADVNFDDLQQVWRTNVGAPFELTGELLPWLVESRGILLGVSSDAAVQHYQTWGLYGASKAALDHVMLTYGAEAGLAAYTLDPGDMRTQMHQDAFPGEDIGDRPLPGTVVPAILRLLEQRPAPGRYRAEAL